MSLFFSIWSKNFKEAVDPRMLPCLPSELIRYGRESRLFRRQYTGDYPVKILPVLFDRKKHSPFDAQYVYQAYWATHRILGIHPSLHVDISSHIPLVTQLSAHVPVIQMELNPSSIELPSLMQVSGSLLDLPFQNDSVLCLSCLHVIEHVGLGRYGDPVDGNGCWKALGELQRVVAPGGHFLLSLPLGRGSIHFNAGYVFRASDIVAALEDVELLEFSFVDDDGHLIENVPIQVAAKVTYALGLFHLKKPVKS